MDKDSLHDSIANRLATAQANPPLEAKDDPPRVPPWRWVDEEDLPVSMPAHRHPHR